MIKNNSTVKSEYMKFVIGFHNTIRERNIILVYEGEINQSITKVFSAMTEQNSDVQSASARAQKRIYHVMVECLQNVAKHADCEKTGAPIYPGRGVFFISNNDSQYTITTGNVVSNDKVETISTMINKFNALNPEEIKSEYKKMIKESRLSDKAGAGLGFIDIVKKTGNKIDFHFETINDKTSFFIQKSIINND